MRANASLVLLDIRFRSTSAESPKARTGTSFSTMMQKIEHYRTPEVNEVIGCVAELSKGLGENKSRTFQNSFEKSGLVPPSRPILNDILEDTRDLARIWDLYGHLLKEEKP